MLNMLLQGEIDEFGDSADTGIGYSIYQLGEIRHWLSIQQSQKHSLDLSIRVMVALIQQMKLLITIWMMYWNYYLQSHYIINEYCIIYEIKRYINLFK